MQKIISGKMYNTETAKLVGVYANDYPSNDFSWVRESLYRKRTGEFFLHGEGGATTKYAKFITDNNWSEGSEIIPLSFEAARKWAEKYMPSEAYQDYFGEIPEDEGRKTISISIAASSHEKAKRKASIEGISLSEYIERLILEDADF